MTATLSPAIPDDVEARAHALLERVCERDLTLATAESCTGGLLASLLTDVEGCGHAFERGYVVYSEAAKCDLLGVRREQLDDCGAVSREVAVAMAKGALDRSRATIALSITGFAGKGGDGDEEGLVHFGCAREGRATLHREMHYGDVGRGAVRLECLRTALDLIGEAID